MRSVLKPGMLLLLTVLISNSALAATVYRWVDHNGVTSYSDTPPASTATGSEELLIDLPRTGVDPIVAKRREAMKSLLPFATTYLAEQGFSALTVIKAKYRGRLPPGNDMRLALTTIKPRFERLAAMKQHQGAH